jgi:3-oxoacyl-[acyl-carrier protein] reductase
MRLQGQAAVITGGNGGIGRAVVLALAAEGCHVTVVGGHDLAAAEAVAREAEAFGVTALARRADVSDAGQAEAVVTETAERFGRLDILVNNAGITRDGLLLRMTEADWDAVLDVNLKGAFHCTKAALRSMVRQRRGRIVNVASIVGMIGNAGQANYAAAKAGLIGFTRATAREVASRGVLVNAVAPGFIRTRMTDVLPESAREALQKQIPLGRLGEPEDVAPVVLFLCLPDAGYVTGQVLVVDGGVTG